MRRAKRLMTFVLCGLLGLMLLTTAMPTPMTTTTSIRSARYAG